MSESAWSHWHPLTAAGYAEERAILELHMPDCRMAEQGLSHGVPCVVGYDSGRLVVVTAKRAPVWDDGPVVVSVKRDSRGEPYGSAGVTAGNLHATNLSVPFVLAVEVFAKSAGSG